MCVKKSWFDTIILKCNICVVETVFISEWKKYLILLITFCNLITRDLLYDKKRWKSIILITFKEYI